MQTLKPIFAVMPQALVAVAAIGIGVLWGTRSTTAEDAIGRPGLLLAQGDQPTAIQRPTATQQVTTEEKSESSTTPLQRDTPSAVREEGGESDAAEQQAALRGITETLKAQFAACNEENLDKLLPHISAEMPGRSRFVNIVDASWSVSDTYCRLDDVELLSDSDNPGAQFEHPYATVRVTQTVISLPVSEPMYEVFLRKCKKDDSKLLELAEQLGLKGSSIETSNTELLYKDEGGSWKLVTALAEPIPCGPDAGKATSTGMGVPFQQKMRRSRSVFK